MRDHARIDRILGPCRCDFCTGRKRYEENWCARCGNVKLTPPKHWENLDVCGACDVAIKAEIEADGRR